MKKEEVEKLLNHLGEIKQITDKQEYLVSKNVNLNIMEMTPILNNELKRLDFNEIECNSPQITLIKRNDIEDLQEEMNNTLEKLTMNDYKIIDFDIKNIFNEKTHEIIYTGVIKYTS